MRNSIPRGDIAQGAFLRNDGEIHIYRALIFVVIIIISLGAQLYSKIIIRLRRTLIYRQMKRSPRCDDAHIHVEMSSLEANNLPSHAAYKSPCDTRTLLLSLSLARGVQYITFPHDNLSRLPLSRRNPVISRAGALALPD